MFPSQLRFLALADLIFLSAGIVVMLVSFISVSLDWKSTLCSDGYIVLRFGRFVGLFHEMHIAVCFWMKSVRSPFLGVFAKGLPWLWLVGFLATVVSACLEQWQYDSQFNACGPNHWETGADVVTFVVIGLCVVVCIASYSHVLIRAFRRQPPASVVSGVLKRTEMFILNAVICYTLLFFVYSRRRWFSNGSLRTVAFSFENLGGFLNTVTYAMQSRYGSMMVGDRGGLFDGERSGEQRLSYRVDLGPVDVVEIVQPSMTETSSSEAATSRATSIASTGLT